MDTITSRFAAPVRALPALGTGLLCAALLAALLLGISVSSAEAKECMPKIREGWVRMPPGKMPMAAGFGRIVNPCPMPATIVGASSPSFGSVELHETRTVDGVSRMRHMPELRLAPDGAAMLKPGGMHLMLMQPRVPLQPGSRIVIELELKGGGTLLGEFEVRKTTP
ncbi:MAG: copper chaperone PCu(A)C [Lysobacteraceae bacterium]|nr:MAG: copper chaperone PCu(A)C [Xanthomonadaceae bacterium]